MKLTCKDRLCIITVDNPDERMKADIAARVRDIVHREINEFLQEVAVELRRLQPGETRKLSSRPIEVEISTGEPSQ